MLFQIKKDVTIPINTEQFIDNIPKSQQQILLLIAPKEIAQDIVDDNLYRTASFIEAKELAGRAISFLSDNNENPFGKTFAEQITSGDALVVKNIDAIDHSTQEILGALISSLARHTKVVLTASNMMKSAVLLSGLDDYDTYLYDETLTVQSNNKTKDNYLLTNMMTAKDVLLLAGVKDSILYALKCYSQENHSDSMINFFYSQYMAIINSPDTVTDEKQFLVVEPIVSSEGEVYYDLSSVLYSQLGSESSKLLNEVDFLEFESYSQIYIDRRIVEKFTLPITAGFLLGYFTPLKHAAPPLKLKNQTMKMIQSELENNSCLIVPDYSVDEQLEHLNQQVKTYLKDEVFDGLFSDFSDSEREYTDDDIDKYKKIKYYSYFDENQKETLIQAIKGHNDDRLKAIIDAISGDSMDDVSKWIISHEWERKRNNNMSEYGKKLFELCDADTHTDVCVEHVYISDEDEEQWLDDLPETREGVLELVEYLEQYDSALAAKQFLDWTGYLRNTKGKELFITNEEIESIVGRICKKFDPEIVKQFALISTDDDVIKAFKKHGFDPDEIE